MAEETGSTGQAGPKDSTNMGMLCHLLGLFWIIGPLIIWLIKKDTDPFVDDQGKEALNWQITVTIGYVVGGLTACIGIGVFIMGAVYLCDLIFCIMGAVTASSGKKYRYPICIRLLK